jgi:hypothetical protein
MIKRDRELSLDVRSNQISIYSILHAVSLVGTHYSSVVDHMLFTLSYAITACSATVEIPTLLSSVEITLQ